MTVTPLLTSAVAKFDTRSASSSHPSHLATAAASISCSIAAASSAPSSVAAAMEVPTARCATFPPENMLAAASYGFFSAIQDFYQIKIKPDESVRALLCDLRHAGYFKQLAQRAVQVYEPQVLRQLIDMQGTPLYDLIFVKLARWVGGATLSIYEDSKLRECAATPTAYAEVWEHRSLLVVGFFLALGLDAGKVDLSLQQRFEEAAVSEVAARLTDAERYSFCEFAASPLGQKCADGLQTLSLWSRSLDSLALP